MPYYPQRKRDRPPRGIELMLRMHLLQSWFNLSDEGLEDAIYDSCAMRNFAGINFLEEQVPDATTLLITSAIKCYKRCVKGRKKLVWVRFGYKTKKKAQEPLKFLDFLWQGT